MLIRVNDWLKLPNSSQDGVIQGQKERSGLSGLRQQQALFLPNFVVWFY